MLSAPTPESVVATNKVVKASLSVVNLMATGVVSLKTLLLVVGKFHNFLQV